MKLCAIDVDQHIVLEQVHLEAASDELGREAAVHLSIQGKQDRHIVFEELVADVRLRFLHAFPAGAGTENVNRDGKPAKLLARVFKRELRLDDPVVAFQTTFQAVDRGDRVCIVRIALIVVDCEEGEGWFKKKLVEAAIEVARNDRTRSRWQLIGIEFHKGAGPELSLL
jgi:hypothetical protein